MSAFSDALIKFVVLNYSVTGTTYRIADLANFPDLAIGAANIALSSSDPELKAAAEMVIDEAQRTANKAQLAAANTSAASVAARRIRQDDGAPSVVAAEQRTGSVTPVESRRDAGNEPKSSENRSGERRTRHRIDKLELAKQWANFGKASVDENGPLAAKMVLKICTDNPWKTPKDCRASIEDAFGPTVTHALFKQVEKADLTGDFSGKSADLFNTVSKQLQAADRRRDLHDETQEMKEAWEAFNESVVHECGPLGSKMVAKLRRENPSKMPSQCKYATAALFGEIEAKVIFQHLKLRRT